MAFNFNDEVVRMSGPNNFSTTINEEGDILVSYTYGFLFDKNGNRYQMPFLYGILFDNGKFESASSDQIILSSNRQGNYPAKNYRSYSANDKIIRTSIPVDFTGSVNDIGTVIDKVQLSRPQDNSGNLYKIPLYYLVKFDNGLSQCLSEDQLSIYPQPQPVIQQPQQVVEQPQRITRNIILDDYYYGIPFVDVVEVVPVPVMPVFAPMPNIVLDMDPVVYVDPPFWYGGKKNM
jgi:hypothetical protein